MRLSLPSTPRAETLLFGMCCVLPAQTLKVAESASALPWRGGPIALFVACFVVGIVAVRCLGNPAKRGFCLAQVRQPQNICYQALS